MTTLRISRFVLVVCILAKGGFGQESRPHADLERDRVADPAAWKPLLTPLPDPPVLSRVLISLGRVGAPELTPLLANYLRSTPRSTDAALQRAEAIAVGLFGDPDLLPLLADHVHVGAFAKATGMVGRLPADKAKRDLVVKRLQGRPEGMFIAVDGAGYIQDPDVSRFVYCSRLKEPILHEEGARLLKNPKSSGMLDAVAYYFARHKKPAPAEAAKGLADLLVSKEPETAANAARALSRIEAAGENAAGQITGAYLCGGPRIVQIDRLRALAALPPAPARAALLSALKDDDPHLRRTALETLASLAPGLEDRDRRGLAGLAATMTEVDPEVDVAAASVGALAALDPKAFLKALARYRLADPWQIRAAAARALGGIDWSERQVAWKLHRFGRDPDRRVRQAFLEAAVKRAAKIKDEKNAIALGTLLSLLDRRPHEVIFSGSRLPFDRGDSIGVPMTHDPVELGLLAQLARALLSNADARKAIHPQLDMLAFLEATASRLPWPEIESWQFVIKLAEAAGGKTGEEVLQLAAHCREGSLRRMARGILKAQGKPLVQPKDEILKRYRRTIDSIPAFYIGVPVEKASAVIRTIKGDIHLRFLPAEAPITVHNFLTMARGGYYDGILFHRVVPGFVAQAGCPRGDGWGGPGYTIPCENSDRTYRRGSLGMALAGKDTGGSQWFLCHRSVPHLDGRYTLFGEVSKGLDVLDSLVQGDVILSVEVR